MTPDTDIVKRFEIVESDIRHIVSFTKFGKDICA